MDIAKRPKNADIFHSVLVIILVVFSLILLTIKVLPNMTSSDITIVSFTTILFLMDALIFLIGFNLFYPGFG